MMIFQRTGLLAPCVISSNRIFGIGAETSHNLSLSDCHILSNQFGVGFDLNSLGHLKNCEISDCSMVGAGGQDSSVSFLQCQIHDCTAGINLVGDFSGTIDGCRVYGNTRFGIGIDSGSNPVIRNCTITGNRGPGVKSAKKSGGRIENCDLSGNNGRAWEAHPKSSTIDYNNRK